MKLKTLAQDHVLARACHAGKRGSELPSLLIPLLSLSSFSMSFSPPSFSLLFIFLFLQFFLLFSPTTFFLFFLLLFLLHLFILLFLSLFLFPPLLLPLPLPASSPLPPLSLPPPTHAPPPLLVAFTSGQHDQSALWGEWAWTRMDSRRPLGSCC